MALFDVERKWTERVNRVFSTMPRDGALPHSFWLHRDMEESLEDLLHQEGAHVCVDGPTGTGKTSLVKTSLSKSKKKYFEIQWTNNTSWMSFCRKIIGDLVREDEKFSIDVIAGFKGIIPEASIKFSFGKSKKTEAAAWREIGDIIDETDIARVIELSGRVLFIDDFEKASKDLIVRIADLCKILTQKHRGKIIIVGTDDIYSRLLAADTALDSRLKELGVGVLKSPDHAWKFLCLGFKELNIRDPQTYFDQSLLSFDQLRICREQVYDATDSLPKALNEFGREVCLAKRFREEISENEMRERAQALFYKKVGELERLFPDFARLFLSTVEIRMVMEGIYSWPIGAILQTDELFRLVSAESNLGQPQFEHALQILAEKKIITVTGKNRETIFVSNLPLAHTFGVCVAKREKYKLAERAFGKIGQFSLPFYKTPQGHKSRS